MSKNARGAAAATALQHAELVEQPRPPSRSRFAALLLVPAAALVAMLLVALRLSMQPPVVPAYAMEVAGAQQGAADEEAAFSRGAPVEIALRPSTPVAGAVAVRAFVVRDGTERGWQVRFDVSPDGSARLAGPAGALFAGVPDGSWDIVVVVGRPEVLPMTARAALREPQGASAWRAMRTRVRIGP